MICVECGNVEIDYGMVCTDCLEERSKTFSGAIARLREDLDQFFYDALLAPITGRTKCGHCHQEICFSPRAGQWWHRWSGALHCNYGRKAPDIAESMLRRGLDPYAASGPRAFCPNTDPEWRPYADEDAVVESYAGWGGQPGGRSEYPPGQGPYQLRRERQRLMDLAASAASPTE